MYDLSKVVECFPFGVFREGQREVIVFAANAFNDGKRYVIIEGPTGAGKSAIATCLANMVQYSYYLTITKILQDQLVREFGDTIVELKGRASYPCTYWPLHGQSLVNKGVISQKALANNLAASHSCGDGFCVSDAKDEEKRGRKCLKCFLGNDWRFAQSLPSGMKFSSCPYYEQVEQALIARKVVMNFHAFLYQTQMSHRFDIMRDLLIVDECHNCESILMDFIAISIDDKLLQQYGKSLPEFDEAAEYALWFEDNDIGKLLVEAYSDLNDKLIGAVSSDVKEKLGIIRAMDDIGRLGRRYKLFMESIAKNNGTEWIAESDQVEFAKSKYNRVTLKPVMVGDFAQTHLLRYGKNVLLMSATILDVNTFCRSIGVSPTDVASYRMRNRFPARSRPIYYQPVAKITGGAAGQLVWGPSLVAGVEDRVRAYPMQRGIIHTHNFAIADMLYEQCAKDVRDRFSYQKNFLDKAALLDYHTFNEKSVLIAPALSEGIDLIGELSRFAIICKTPYPNFYDNKQMIRRMELDEMYYTWLTALKLVQSYGRSVRSDTDYADTYIIDSAFAYFYHKAKRILPGWFKEAICWNSESR